MLKFIHTADLHLGITYDTLPSDKAIACQNAQFDALSRVVKNASKYNVDAILIAGDLFDSPTPPARVFRRAAEIIASAHCPVLLSPGNHDHICSDSIYLCETLPDNLHVFTTTTLEPFALNAECMVWGGGFDGSSASIPLLAPITPTLKNVCLIHADLKDDSQYNAYSSEDIAASGFDYLAAGHNHSGSVLKKAGKTWYCRPGSLMATKWTESGTKGCFYVELDDTVRIKPIIGGGLEFENYTVDISPVASDVGLQQLILKLIPDHHDHVIASFLFTGERVYEPNWNALASALDKVFFHCTIQNDTVVKKPLWRYLQSNDLRGSVSRTFRDRLAAAQNEEEKSELLLALRYALSAFDNDDPPK